MAGAVDCKCRISDGTKLKKDHPCKDNMTLYLRLVQSDIYQDLIEKKVSSLKQQLGLEERICFQINLILDEICTNIFHNNSDSDELCIDISISAEKGKLTIIFEDNGISFDPTSVVEPNTNLSLNKREEGGLGLFLVKKFTNTFSYSKVNGKNQTTVRKDLKKPYVTTINGK